MAASQRSLAPSGGLGFDLWKARAMLPHLAVRDTPLGRWAKELLGRAQTGKSACRSVLTVLEASLRFKVPVPAFAAGVRDAPHAGLLPVKLDD